MDADEKLVNENAERSLKAYEETARIEKAKNERYPFDGYCPKALQHRHSVNAKNGTTCAIECALNEAGFTRRKIEALEARLVADRICDASGVDRIPVIKITNRAVSRRKGTYFHSGKILLHGRRDGDSMGTLIHEVAHHLVQSMDEDKPEDGAHGLTWRRRFAWASDFEMSGEGERYRKKAFSLPSEISPYRPDPLARQGGLFGARTAKPPDKAPSVWTPAAWTDGPLARQGALL